MNTIQKQKSVYDIHNISFSYDNLTVLENINVKINVGDFVAILGPNGGGKSTFIKLLLGLIKPTNGQILYNGTSINNDAKKNIGYVAQKVTHIDPLFPATVKDVVTMGLTANSTSNVIHTHKVIESLTHVGMQKYLDYRIQSLSGGQQQRVFIARALVSNPNVLILDEPTTGIDSRTQGEFFDLLHHLNKVHNMTILLVSHDISTVTKYATHILCLNKKVTFYGTLAEFTKKEQHSLINKNLTFLTHEHCCNHHHH